MNARKLYVGFSRPCTFSLVSMLIRWAESPKRWGDPRSWFSLYHSSHVLIVFPSKPNRRFFMVQEAAGAQVRWVSEMHFLIHCKFTRLYEITMDKTTYDAIKTYGEQYAGAPYAFWENVGIAYVRIMKALGFIVKNPFAGGEKVQKCSELVCRNVILRLLDMNVATLSHVVGFERGHVIPSDLDTVGVRDMEEALEMMAQRKLVTLIAPVNHLKVL